MMQRWVGTGLRVGVVALVAITVAACGQAPSGSESSGGSRTAVVDLNSVAKALGRDEAIQQQLQSATQQLNQKLVQAAQQMQKNLQEQQEKLKESGEDQADQEQLNKLKQQFVQARRNIQVNKAKAQLVQRRAKAQLVQQFRQEVKPIAQRIAERQGADVVVVANSDVLWFDPASDITDEVIAEMRAAGHTGSSGSGSGNASQQGGDSGSGSGSQSSGDTSSSGSGQSSGASSNGGSSSGQSESGGGSGSGQ